MRKQNLSVLSLSASDQAGGAAIACYRIHSALRERGVHVKIATQIKRGEDEDVFEIPRPTGLAAKALFRRRAKAPQRALKPYRWTRPFGMEIFTLPVSPFRTPAALLDSFDALHLHWVSHMIDWPSFFATVTKPIIWTLHDMNSFTGGCHYASDCENFQSTCGACPQLGSTRSPDLSTRIQSIKQQSLANLPVQQLTLVTPSAWLKRKCESSRLLAPYACHHIPNGIDLEFWKPTPAPQLREELGIPSDHAIVLFVAEVISSKRKGFLDLLQAFTQIAGNVTLLSIGSVSSHWRPPFRCVSLGKQTDSARLRELYSLADVFVCPSHEDNQPNTIVEAMACATPIVAFRVGGIPEIVSDGETGALVDLGDIRSLAAAVTRLVKYPEEARQLGAAAHRFAKAAFSSDVCAARYERVYREAIEAR